MSKIRINELARELEVKPNVILDKLRELGVADKKTHSSSLDDDVAQGVRRLVAGGDHSEEPQAETTRPSAPPPLDEPVRPPAARQEVAPARQEIARPEIARPEAARPEPSK